MKNPKKRFVSLILSLAMLLTMVPMGIPFAGAEEGEACITVSDTSALPGDTVTVDVSIAGNPGILGATLSLSYDSNLTLTGVQSGEAFSPLVMTKPGKFSSPCNFVWDGQELATEDIKDGTILTLTFTVSEEAEAGSDLPVTLSYATGSITNYDLKPVTVEIQNGAVTVIDYIPGDLNGDGSVNATDIILNRRYVAGGYDITINEDAAEVNQDNLFNSTDIILMRRFVAGGYGVVLLPRLKTCNHELEKVAKTPATCVKEGNREYWRCTSCNQCFSDAEGKTKISLDSTVIAATGEHTYVDGVCTGCGMQEEVTPPATGEYTITYDVANGDSYLQEQNIANSNPISFDEDDSITLKNLSVSGYRFLGWFDGAGSNAEQVKKIEAGTTEDIELYAHWEKIEYTIRFTYSMIDSGPYSKEEEKVKPITYTVDQGATLQPLKLDTYRFVGWSDSTGHIYKDYKIPVGTAENITLKDNWVSTRNEAKPKTVLDDPLVVEDTDNQKIYFCYDIGTIENVPLYTTQELLCVNGIITIKEKNTTHKITNTEMNAWGSELSNQTTDSTQFTLSKELSEITEVSERYIEENGLDKEVAETQAKSQSNTESYSSSSGGSHEDYAYNDSTTRNSTNESYVVNKNFDAGVSHELQTGFKNTTELSVGVSLPIDILSLNAGVKNTTEISANTDTKSYMDYSVGSTSTWNKDTYDESYQANSSTDNKYWNNSSSKSAEYESSQSKTVTSAIHQLVSEEYGYGKTYANKTVEQEDYGKTYAKSATTNSSTAITFTEEAIESETVGYSTTGYTFGSYRLVMAGTMHVIAVVGYDVASNEYFVYTDMIMGDGTCNDGYHEIIDYSYDRSFTDQQNSVIPFSIPSYVEDYVNTRIVRSEGLAYDFDTKKHTAVVEAYSGSDKIVYIPSYVVDEEGSAYKVTGIDSKAFQSNSDIVSISLGRYVSEIPSSAFKGCTSLEYVVCPAVTKIGDNAFDGCTSLKEFKVSEQITSLGEKAFANVPQILVNVGYDEENPENARQVAMAAASSGADSISLDLSNLPQDVELELSVPSGESFVLTAGNKLSSGELGNRVFTNLTLESHAATTEVKNIEFLNCQKIPMSLYSDKVTLYNVDVENCGYYAMLLANENTELTLSGTSTFVSSGATAIVCDSVSVLSKNSGKLKVTGDILRCGTISDSDGKISFVGQGTIKEISREEFERYIEGTIGISFDANGGTVEKSSMTAYSGVAVGELPVPVRDGFAFSGWYTTADSGEKVTEETVFSAVNDITLYAHWTANSYPINWNTGTGYTISVNRTSSPYGNETTGAIENGKDVCYGDVLSVVYAAETGYTLGDCGKQSITVTGAVTEKDIYASATANKYTYNIVYRSVNGTQLGTSSATYEYGTTNTITPPSFSGYTTPSAQSVVWDSTSPKTITFTYGIAYVSTTPWMASGTWWTPGYGGITYSASLELGTRSANSIQVRVVWTQTITSAFFGYAQYASAYSGNANANWNVAEATTFYNSGSSMTGSNVTYSPWMTVSVTPTQTSAYIICYYSDGSGGDGNASSWSANYAIPTY